MVANYELSQLKSLPLYREANELLNIILCRQKPDLVLLLKLYKKNEAAEIISHIEKYYSEYTFEVTCYTKSPNRVGSKSYTSDLLYEWN